MLDLQAKRCNEVIVVLSTISVEQTSAYVTKLDETIAKLAIVSSNSMKLAIVSSELMKL